jgi:hypothetical protein
VTWFDPELFLYALVGILVIAIGARALGYWVVDSWAAGRRLVPSAIVAVAMGCVGAALVALRSHKRWLYVGVALAVVGAVCFLLASLGFELPRSWVE